MYIICSCSQTVFPWLQLTPPGNQANLRQSTFHIDITHLSAAVAKVTITLPLRVAHLDEQGEGLVEVYAGWRALVVHLTSERRVRWGSWPATHWLAAQAHEPVTRLHLQAQYLQAETGFSGRHDSKRHRQASTTGVHGKRICDWFGEYILCICKYHFITFKSVSKNNETV